MASVVNAPNPGPVLSDQEKADALLAEAVKRIEAGRTVGKVMDLGQARTFDVTHAGFSVKANPHLKPMKTAAKAVESWERHLLELAQSGAGIDWKIKPEIAPSGDGWAVYARVGISWSRNMYTGKVSPDGNVFERAPPPPYLPAAAEEAQAAVRFLRARLQEAEAGNIVAVGMVIVRPDNRLVDVGVVGVAGHRHALVSGTVSLLHELNEAGKVPK